MVCHKGNLCLNLSHPSQNIKSFLRSWFSLSPKEMLVDADKKRLTAVEKVRCSAPDYNTVSVWYGSRYTLQINREWENSGTCWTDPGYEYSGFPGSQGAVGQQASFEAFFFKLSIARILSCIICIMNQHVRINAFYEIVPLLNVYRYWYFSTVYFLKCFWDHQPGEWLAHCDLRQVIYPSHISVLSPSGHKLKWGDICEVLGSVSSQCMLIPSYPYHPLYLESVLILHWPKTKIKK